MKQLILAFLAPAFFCLHAHAEENGCANDLKAEIYFHYSEGGLSVKNIVGPILWPENEKVTGLEISSELISMAAYAVNWEMDREVGAPGMKGNVLISVQCTNTQPSQIADTNKDGLHNLNDATTKGL